MFLYTEPTCYFETYVVKPESEVTLKKAEFTAFLHGLQAQYISRKFKLNKHINLLWQLTGLCVLFIRLS